MQFFKKGKNILQYEGEVQKLDSGGFSFQGEGTLYDERGRSVYQGNWLNGKRSGKGTAWLADGIIYSGNWIDDQQDGQGTYLFSTGEEYQGNFLKGKKHGQGTYTFADGGKYLGDFRDGLFH